MTQEQNDRLKMIEEELERIRRKQDSYESRLREREKSWLEELADLSDPGW